MLYLRSTYMHILTIERRTINLKGGINNANNSIIIATFIRILNMVFKIIINVSPTNESIKKIHVV